MSIRVLYFASLKDRVGRGGDVIAATQITTVEEVWLAANPNHPIPQNTLIAVNMEYADLHTQVTEGDEVAFFPPVTGG